MTETILTNKKHGMLVLLLTLALYVLAVDRHHPLRRGSHGGPHGGVHRLPLPGLDLLSGAEGAGPSGGPGAHPLRPSMWAP